MGKASRRKQLKRAGLLEEMPMRQESPGCTCSSHVTRTININLGELPEDIRREIAIWNEDEEGEEERRTVVRICKEVDCDGHPLSYGVEFDDGEKVGWSAW